jgi:hypothetical protein
LSSEWINLHTDVKTINLILSDETIKDITDNITMDASNTVRVSNVNDKTTSSETYTPDYWKDKYYDDLFNQIDFVVNPTKILKSYSSWLMKYTNNHKTGVHDHKDFDMVAIYYISAPEGSGVLHFPKLNIEIKPYTGLLVVHDSMLKHGVRANTIEGIERYCAVVNYRYNNEPI